MQAGHAITISLGVRWSSTMTGLFWSGLKLTLVTASLASSGILDTATSEQWVYSFHKLSNAMPRLQYMLNIAVSLQICKNGRCSRQAYMGWSQSLPFLPQLATWLTLVGIPYVSWRLLPKLFRRKGNGVTEQVRDISL